jgi:hypothetical protein
MVLFDTKMTSDIPECVPSILCIVCQVKEMKDKQYSLSTSHLYKRKTKA